MLSRAAGANPSDEGRPLFNSAVLLRGGRVEQRFRRHCCDFDVFDETYCGSAHGAQLLDIAGTRVGISICEDIWNDRDFWKRRRYHHDPIDELAAAGASLVVNMSASPFTAGKHRRREEMLGSMAHKHRLPIAYVNQFGGNDDLVFDGRSSVFGADGAAIARGRAFDADVVVCDVTAARPIAPANDLDVESEIWRALVLGTRDYMRKCGSAAVLGLSGGIDWALTAAIAVDAVGADHVPGVLMPSPTRAAAASTCACIGGEPGSRRRRHQPLMHTFNGVLREGLGTDPPGVAAENVRPAFAATR